MRRSVFASTFLLATAAFAGLVRIQVLERSDVLDGKPFGRTGAYERLVGRAYFAVDPALAANRIICDLDLAPRDAAGKVEFSADLYVLQPRDPKAGNGTVLFEVSNRGGKGMLGMFNRAAGSLDPSAPEHFGDGLLLEEGFTLVWLGWEFDVPPGDKLLRLYTPAARAGDRAITGLVRSEYVPDQQVTSFSLADRAMAVTYPVADPSDPAVVLTLRERVDGPRRTIPRNRWSFSPDRTRVIMEAGFEPGRLYDVVYKAQDPALAGLGPAAVRDFISFLKYGGTPEQGHLMLADQHQHLKRAIGFGSSQSGRFLRTFVYYGFNQDERGRKVFDGLIPHVAGAGRGSYNHRFAQPSRDAHPHLNTLYPTVLFPFTDLDQTDPLTGLTDGLLRRARTAGVVPRIFHTNGSYEYYGRASALIHTTLDGRQDAPLPPETRVYLFAGSQHGPSPWPPPRGGTQNLRNPNDFRYSMRALLMALHRWLAEGVAPPPSRYPKIADGQLVPLARVRFPRLPSVAIPTRIYEAYRLDFGPQFRTRGIVSLEPPTVGPAFSALIPQVDADGNELGGIRLPDVAVPLGVYTGWNLRDPALGAPDELYSMAGSFIPFPRAEIEKRYPSRSAYLDKVAAAVRELIREGYLLERDRSPLLDRAGRQWDHLAAPR
jgi:hypothetical protein